MASSRTRTGVVTIVQEGRFQVTDDDGVSHLFLLSRMAALEPAQLRTLQRDQARVCVRYTAAVNVIGNAATAVFLVDDKKGRLF